MQGVAYFNPAVRSGEATTKGGSVGMSLFAPLPGFARGYARPNASTGDRMRPVSLDEFVRTGDTFWLRTSRCGYRSNVMIPSPSSSGGPPGVGKTTLAKIIARVTKADFIEFLCGARRNKKIKQVMADAQKARELERAPSSSSMRFNRFNQGAARCVFCPTVEIRQHPGDRGDYGDSVIRSD